MFIVVMGATGHVGSAVAACLLAQGQPVAVVTRDAKRAAAWVQRGAQVVVADLQDVDRLRSVFRTGRRAFVLNPPAPVATDTDLQERRTAFQILVALEGSGLEKVVAPSTYGAQPGQYLGDLSTLHAFEQGLHYQRIPLAIVRAAYLFTNWDAWWPNVARTGILRTLYPMDMGFPMVDPIDLGREVMNQLLGEDSRMCHVEGPRPYSPRDVAQTFARRRGRPVQVQVQEGATGAVGERVPLGFGADRSLWRNTWPGALPHLELELAPMRVSSSACSAERLGAPLQVLPAWIFAKQCSPDHHTPRSDTRISSR